MNAQAQPFVGCNNPTIHVPVGSAALYQAASGWSLYAAQIVSP
jgi:hypothetical protein